MGNGTGTDSTPFTELAISQVFSVTREFLIATRTANGPIPVSKLPSPKVVVEAALGVFLFLVNDSGARAALRTEYPDIANLIDDEMIKTVVNAYLWRLPHCLPDDDAAFLTRAARVGPETLPGEEYLRYVNLEQRIHQEKEKNQNRLAEILTAE